MRASGDIVRCSGVEGLDVRLVTPLAYAVHRGVRVHDDLDELRLIRSNVRECDGERDEVGPNVPLVPEWATQTRVATPWLCVVRVVNLALHRLGAYDGGSVLVTCVWCLVGVVRITSGAYEGVLSWI